MQSFDTWFKSATGHEPFPYQRRLACSADLPDIVDIPTGLGKTAAMTLAWLWRRRQAEDGVRAQTPRRLIYCLPSRVLVTQTATTIRSWLTRLERNAACDLLAKPISVHVLMGGDVDEAWLEHPEADAVLVGTQDMLLSRALNRGYGMSRYLWPMAFAGVHADALWVFDELQLMGAGLPCSAQMQAFRDSFGAVGSTKSVWMSATATASGLETVNHPRPSQGWLRLKLDAVDNAHPLVVQRTTAAKILRQAAVSLGSTAAERKDYANDLAQAVLAEHQADTLTLVVVNRVDRAQAVFKALQKTLLKAGRTTTNTALIHSRFRPYDRARQERLLGVTETQEADRIIVATQTVEAGVDISSATLWTELAPWSSLVQRMGRCHRYGEMTSAGRVFWIDLPADSKVTLPYDLNELDDARRALAALPICDGEEQHLPPLKARNCGLQALATVAVTPPFKVLPVPRRRDLLDLFDTDSDLSGDDLDVSRFIRDSDDTDVQLYWRDIGDTPGKLFIRPHRDELCRVTISALGKALKGDGKLVLWQWNHLDRRWQQARRAVPGRTYLVDVQAGHYDADLGWVGTTAKKAVPVVTGLGAVNHGDGANQEADPRSTYGRGPWVRLSAHLGHVATEMMTMLPLVALPNDLDETQLMALRRALVRAARWHDVGKAHEAFQYMLAGDDDDDNKDAALRGQLWAKSGDTAEIDETADETADDTQPNKKQKKRRPSTVLRDSAGNPVLVSKGPQQGDVRRHVRRGFRHELASALSYLQACKQGDDSDERGATTTAYHDLIAYLIAAHHGKVRMRIAPLPGEQGRKQADATGQLFARGVWHGDALAEVDLGDGTTAPQCSLDLSLMSLGEGPLGPSWSARTAALLQAWGPFQLAWLETLVRLADWRASAAERQGQPTTLPPENQGRRASC